MGIDNYVFAIFIFVLICAVLVICRALFFNMKKQKLQLDEKEAKLLKLYQTVEDAMDEFFDMTEDAKADMAEEAKKLSALAAGIYKTREATSSQSFKSGPADPVIRVSEDQLKEQLPHPKEETLPMQDFSETLSKAAESVGVANPLRPPPSIKENILRLSEEGKTRKDIAKKLNITQNEVELVVGMNKKT